MQIFMIQKLESGIAESPKVFADEDKADEYYVDIVNETFGNYHDDATTLEEADKICTLEEDSDTVIKYFVSDIDIIDLGKENQTDKLGF